MSRGAISPPDASRLVSKIRSALVVLISEDRHGKAKSFGTGFFISPDGVLVTARHVAQAQKNLVALTQDGRKLPVTGFIGEDRDYDIAVVKTDAGQCAHLVLAHEAMPRTNQWAGLVSARDKIAPACSTGVVASVISFSGMFAMITTTVPVRPGQSGSPLLDAEGEVIGAVPYASPSQSATASPVAAIREILAKAETNGPTPFSKRPSNGSNVPLFLDADFRPAIDALGRSDWHEADRRLKRVAKRFPESPFTFTALAMVQLRSGQIQAAQASAERAHELRPESAMPYLLRGICFISRGRVADGLSAVRESLEMGLPDHDTTASAWELVARIESGLGHRQQAGEALERLGRLDAKRAAETQSQIENSGTKALDAKGEK